MIVAGLSANTKKVGAVAFGFYMALHVGADVICFVDADNTIPSSEAVKLITAVKLGKADLALGSRLMPLSKCINPEENLNYCLDFHRITNCFSRVFFNTPCIDTESGAKALSKRAAQLWLKEHRCTNLFFDAEMMEILDAGGFNILELPIAFRVNDRFQVKKIFSVADKKRHFLDHAQMVVDCLVETRENGNGSSNVNYL